MRARCGTRASTDVFDCNLAGPTLDQVLPGTGCLNKVQMEPRMLFEPGFYAGILVHAVIVYNQMQVQTGWGLSVYKLPERPILISFMDGCGVFFSMARDAMIIPGVQKPHCMAPYFTNES